MGAPPEPPALACLWQERTLYAVWGGLPLDSLSDAPGDVHGRYGLPFAAGTGAAGGQARPRELLMQAHTGPLVDSCPAVEIGQPLGAQLRERSKDWQEGGGVPSLRGTWTSWSTRLIHHCLTPHHLTPHSSPPHSSPCTYLDHFLQPCDSILQATGLAVAGSNLTTYGQLQGCE